jgi:hypothetical protein
MSLKRTLIAAVPYIVPGDPPSPMFTISKVENTGHCVEIKAYGQFLRRRDLEAIRDEIDHVLKTHPEIR